MCASVFVCFQVVPGESEALIHTYKKTGEEEVDIQCKHLKIHSTRRGTTLQRSFYTDPYK